MAGDRGRPSQAKKDNFSQKLKFPLLLQIKLGEADKSTHADANLVKNVDQTLIQKICVIDRGKVVITKPQEVVSWVDE